VKMRWNEMLKVNRLVDLWNREEKDIFRTRGWIQDSIEDRLQQKKPKRLEEPDSREQKHTGTSCNRNGST